MSRTPSGQVTFVQLPLRALDALAAGDVEHASEASGVTLTPFIASERWLWRLRADQLRASPQDAPWVARVALVDGEVVGHGGYHSAPDGEGVVEVGYSVDPAHRRRGHGSAILRELLRRADREPTVRRVRASINPDNAASLATVARFGFVRVGEQWDEEDGLELVLERDAERTREPADEGEPPTR